MPTPRKVTAALGTAVTQASLVGLCRRHAGTDPTGTLNATQYPVPG